MTATPLYAALLALLFVRLSLGVLRLRRSEKISLGDGGDGGDRKLMRAQRVHANFAEYVPFALILMALAEAQDASIWLVHGMGVALLIGRLAHAHGFGQEPETTNYRTRGMQLTFAVLIVGALTNIVVAFQ